MKQLHVIPSRGDGEESGRGRIGSRRPDSSLWLGMTGAVIALLFAAILLAEEPTTTTTQSPEKKDSALVDASKKSKARPKSSRKPITNADVKKSKGKIVVLPPKPPLEQKVVDPRGPLEKQDQDLRERKAAQVAVGSAEKKVEDLEKELNRIEQSFYDENDATYRDNVIQKRFDQTKRQLDEARKELADARDQLARFKTP